MRRKGRGVTGKGKMCELRGKSRMRLGEDGEGGGVLGWRERRKEKGGVTTARRRIVRGDRSWDGRDC